MNLYEDPEFHCDLTIPPRYHEVAWRRPKNIVPRPKFFGIQCKETIHNSESCFERRKEIRGDTSGFFLIAVASLTKHIAHFLKVVPEQSFENDYTGKFRFGFFENGRLKDVVIDDRLPTSPNGPLLFSDCVNDAFWFPLLEKAYAKFRGGYDKIMTGLPMDSIYHLTGRHADWFDSGRGTSLQFTQFGMFQRINELVAKNCMIICKQNDPCGNNERHGTGFVVIGTTRERRQSNDGISEMRSFVRLRHPSGRIEDSLRNQLSISAIERVEGEGLMDVERFLTQIQCVYHLDLMNILSRDPGIDPFTPLVPVDSPANKHRCRKY